MSQIILLIDLEEGVKDVDDLQDELRNHVLDYVALGPHGPGDLGPFGPPSPIKEVKVFSP